MVFYCSLSMLTRAALYGDIKVLLLLELTAHVIAYKSIPVSGATKTLKAGILCHSL